MPLLAAAAAACLHMPQLTGVCPQFYAGPSKLPEIGKGLGKTVKSFQSAAKVRQGSLLCVAGSGGRLLLLRAAGLPLLPQAGSRQNSVNYYTTIAAGAVRSLAPPECPGWRFCCAQAPAG